MSGVRVGVMSGVRVCVMSGVLVCVSVLHRFLVGGGYAVGFLCFFSLISLLIDFWCIIMYLSLGCLWSIFTLNLMYADFFPYL